MTRSPAFEDFGSTATSTPNTAPTTSEPDPTLLRESHDAGYKLGFDDGVASVETEQNRLRSAISTALQESGFTYFEAREHVMNSMRPLLEAMVNKLLPQIAQASLAPMIAEEVVDLAEKIKMPIKVSCAPDCLEPLNDAISRATTFPVDVMAEDTLTTSQIILTYDDGKTVFDSSALIASISEKLADFYYQALEEEQRYG